MEHNRRGRKRFYDTEEAKKGQGYSGGGF